MGYEDDQNLLDPPRLPTIIPPALIQGPIAKPKDLNISDERWAKVCERIRAVWAADYARDPKYLEKLWSTYSRSLFFFLLKEHGRSLSLMAAAADGMDRKVVENGAAAE